jgi:hypothetical protein
MIALLKPEPEELSTLFPIDFSYDSRCFLEFSRGEALEA